MKYRLFAALWMIGMLLILPSVQAQGSLTLTLSGVPPTCFAFSNGSTSVQVAGGQQPYGYAWNNGQTGQTITGLGAGTYFVTVTDATGTTGADGFVLTQPTPIVVDLVSSTPACGANNGTATVQASGGTPSYSYLWSNGNTGTTANNLAPGQHTVTVTDANACQQTLPVTITSQPGFTVSLIINKAECVGVPDGSAIAVPNPLGPNYTYIWNPPFSTTGIIDSLEGGQSISVTVTDPNTGCQATASGVVAFHTQIQVQVADVDVACAGDLTGSATATATHGNPPYDYTWTFPDSSTVNGQTITNLGVGAYLVEVVDNHGCKGFGVADINELSQLEADFDYSIIECKPDGILVQFSDASTNPTAPLDSWQWFIAWNNDTLTSNLQNPPAFIAPDNTIGVATLTVSSGGCIKTVTDTFYVTGIIDVQVSLDAGSGCDGLPVLISVDGNPNYQYVWTPTDYLTTTGSLDVIVTPPTSQTYTLEVANGTCKDTFIVNITRSNLLLEVNDLGACQAAAVLNAQASNHNTIVWTNAAGDTLGTSLHLNVTAGDSALYIATIADGLGCSLSDSAWVFDGSIEVSLPSVDFPCEAEPLQYGLSFDPDYTVAYQWSASSPLVQFAPSDTSANPFITAPGGQYTIGVVVTNQFSCFDSASVVVEFLELQTVDPGELQVDNCDGLSVTFTNTSGIGGTWYFGDGDTSSLNIVTHDYATSGNYTVIFLPFEYLCAVGDTLSVAVDSMQALTAAIGAEYIDCSAEAQIQFYDQSAHVNPLSTWHWTIGTQTFTTQNPSVVFTTEGTVQAILVVTDVNGCSSSDTLTVQVNIINDEIANLLSVCTGYSVSLNPDTVAGYAYAWTATPPDPTLNANTANPTVTPQQTTLYIATITNGACTVVDSVVVDVDAVQMIEPGQLLADTCNGLAVTFSNNSGFNGTWYFGDGDTSTLNVVTHDYATGGTYTVSFIPLESPCIKGDTFDITFDALQAIAAGIGAEYVDCAANAQIQFFDQSAHTDPIATWMWTIGTQTFNTPNPSAVFTTQGTVQAVLVVTDVNGCRSTDSMAVEINIVNEEISNQQFICVGENVALNPDTVVGYTYVWTANPPDPTLDPNAANPVVSPQQNTVYTVNISNGACTVLDTIEIQPDLAPELNLSVDQMVVCSNDSVNITAQVTGSANQVLWSMTTNFSNPFATGPGITVVPVSNGVYYAMIANSVNCFDIDTVQIDNASFEIENTMAENKVCLGNTITLMVSSDEPNLTYDWTDPLPDDPTQTITPTTSSVYGVTVSNPEGCTKSATFVVDVVVVTATAWVTRDTLVMPGDTTTLIGGPEDKNFNFSWEPAGTVDDPTQRTSTARPTETTVYTLTTELDGCFDTASVIVRVISQTCIDPFIFVPKAFTPNGDGENDLFRARGVDIAELHMIVWNRWGEKVFETENPLDSWDGIFRENPVPPDSYAWFLKVTCGNGEYYEAKGDVTLLR